MINAQTLRTSIALIRRQPTRTADSVTWVQIESTGEVTLQVRTPVEFAPTDLTHGLSCALYLAPGTTPAAVADWLDAEPQFTRLLTVVRGMRIRLFGQDRLGTLTHDARDALDALEESTGKSAYADDTITEWTAAEWLVEHLPALRAAPTLAAAEAIAAQAVEQGQIMDDPEYPGGVIVNLDEARQYARRVWSVN